MFLSPFDRPSAADEYVKYILAKTVRAVKEKRRLFSVFLLLRPILTNGGGVSKIVEIADAGKAAAE